MMWIHPAKRILRTFRERSLDRLSRYKWCVEEFFCTSYTSRIWKGKWEKGNRQTLISTLIWLRTNRQNLKKKMQNPSVEENHVEGTSKKQHLNFQKNICTYKLNVEESHGGGHMGNTRIFKTKLHFISLTWVCLNCRSFECQKVNPICPSLFECT